MPLSKDRSRLTDRQTDRLTDIQTGRHTDVFVDELSSNPPLNCLKMNVTSDCLQYLTSSKRTIAKHKLVYASLFYVDMITFQVFCFFFGGGGGGGGEVWLGYA